MKPLRRRPTALHVLLVAVAGLCSATNPSLADDPVGPVPAPASQTPAPKSPPPAPPAPASTPPPNFGPDALPRPAETPTMIRPAPGDDREITLYLKDGRQIRGDLVEKNAAQFIVRVAGINTSYSVDEVDRFTLLPTVFERYREIRKTVNENDAETMLKLVVWLEDKNQYDLAFAELTGLRKRLPENQTVIRELDRLQRVMDLRKQPNARPGPKPNAPDVGARPDPANKPAAFADPVPRLSEEAVKLMKVYEVDLTRPPQIIVPRDVMIAVFDKYAGHPLVPATREGRDAILRQSAEKKLDLLFRLKAREFYPRVQIVDQPETIKQFRMNVFQSLILNSCATSDCHGGLEAGRLVLATRQPNSDSTIYTNFAILDRFRLANGEPLIDTQQPDKSPLLQMALPRAEAVIRHPQVMRGEPAKDQWRPALRNAQERRFQDAVTWIRSLYTPRPDYDIGYTPIRSFTPPEPLKEPAPVR